MKIMVVSLLRLGDVVMTTAALARLKKKYPKSEIHLMVNSQNKNLEPLLVDVDRVWSFERSEIQNSLGNYSSAYLEPYYRIGSLVEKVNEEKFDLIVNLTQNFLSAFLISLFRAKDKWGMVSGLDGKLELTNDWFRKLNLEPKKVGMNYVDLLGRAVDERPYESLLNLKETDRGQYAVQQVLGSEKGFITIQPLTSDPKKNWGVNNFAELTIELADKMKNQKFVWVGSPFEAEELKPVHEEMLKMGIPVQLVICDLECAFSVVKRSRLLITGDTAIKHLAAAARVKILEIAIGSSDFNFTGAYLSDCVIVTSRQVCAPCHHRLPCSRDQHYCAIDIRANLLGDIVAGWLLKNEIFRHPKSKFEMYKTVFTSSHQWQAVKIGERGTDLENIKSTGDCSL